MSDMAKPDAAERIAYSIRHYPGGPFIGFREADRLCVAIRRELRKAFRDGYSSGWENLCGSTPKANKLAARYGVKL